MKRARLIYNPTSGREKIRKYLPYILERLEQAGYETSTHATTGCGDAIKAAKEAAERKFDLVIAAGGDGTVNEVINGLAGGEFRPTLGIIPCGTTNDFARAMGIPKNIKACCDILCGGHTQPIDIGKANDRYFINVAAGGAMTELTYEVPSKLKTFLGYLAYLIFGVKKLHTLRPYKVKIEYDGNIYEGDIFLFFICNTKSVGGFDKVAALSNVDDGVLDLLVVEKMTVPKLVQAGIKTLSGKHLKDAKIKYHQVKNVKISFEHKQMPINLDGEYGGDTPFEFTCLKHHFELLTTDPNTKNNKKK